MEERRTNLLPRRELITARGFQRCQHKLRGGKYCEFIAVKGSNKCERHQSGGFNRPNGNGGFKTTFGQEAGGGVLDRRIDRSVMPFFKSMLGPKLTMLVKDALEDDKFDVANEIALIKASTAVNIESFNALVEYAGTDEFQTKFDAAAKQKYREQVQVIGQSLRNAMNDITFQIERQARIHNMVAEKIHPGAIQDVVRQLNLFVYECFGKNPDGTTNMEALKKFDQKLNEELRLPTLKPIAPMTANEDVQVQRDIEAMNETVPLFIENQDNQNGIAVDGQSES